MTPKPLFSIVVPMLNEAGSVDQLVREIASTCQPLGLFEAIFVNDGSTDATATRIAVLRSEFPWLRELRHAHPCGQSAAIQSGVIAAQARIICTLDGDGQNPPAEIPKLLQPLLDGFRGLIAGQRSIRYDSVARRFSSCLANTLRRALLKDGVRDTGCGLKAFPRELFLSLPFFDHMHRYLPLLAQREGFPVTLVDVAHRPRATGNSKYTNTARAIAGIPDILGVWWLLRRRKRPQIVRKDD